jgi:hypothetical protein
VRYPYAGRSRVAQSAERPAVNRQVIGSSPIAGASQAFHRQPPHLRQRRKRGNRHGAGSAPAEQDPHNRPAAPPEMPGGRGPAARHAAAVWHENGERQQCEAASEEKLAARLAKVAERLEADAPNKTLRGADLIAFYLSADRLPVQRQWSRKHAHTQRRLCERFAWPSRPASYRWLRVIRVLVSSPRSPGRSARWSAGDPAPVRRPRRRPRCRWRRPPVRRRAHPPRSRPRRRRPRSGP